MSTSTKLKRQLIEEANKRILGEDSTPDSIIIGFKNKQDYIPIRNIASNYGTMHNHNINNPPFSFEVYNRFMGRKVDDLKKALEDSGWEYEIKNEPGESMYQI